MLTVTAISDIYVLSVVRTRVIVIGFASRTIAKDDTVLHMAIVVVKVNVVSITNVLILKIVHDVTVVPTALIPRSAVSELTEMSVGEIVSEKGARRLAIVQVLENTATRVTYVQI